MFSDSSSRIIIREATVDDVPEIVRQRRRMYEDMHYTDVSALERSSSLNTAYLRKAISEGFFRCWLGCIESRAVGGGAVLVVPWPAHPYDLECRRATILNVYTEPGYRRQGIARQIIETMIAWCKQEGFARINLHASEDGRHLYEALGFESSNEMRLRLR